MASSMDIQTAGPIDWFELHPKYFFRGQEIESSLAHRFSTGEVVHFKGSYYRVDPKEVPSMKSLERFWARISGSNRWGVRATSMQAECKLERSKILDLLALKYQGVDVRGDDQWKKIAETFEGLESHQKEAERRGQSVGNRL